MWINYQSPDRCPLILQGVAGCVCVYALDQIVELSPEALAQKMLELGPAAAGTALGAMDVEQVRGQRRQARKSRAPPDLAAHSWFTSDVMLGHKADLPFVSRTRNLLLSGTRPAKWPLFARRRKCLDDSLHSCRIRTLGAQLT